MVIWTIQASMQRMQVLWWRLTVPSKLRQRGLHLGKGVKFYGLPIVSLTPDSKISIGDRSVLCSDSRFTALGVSRPVVLRTLRKGACITIGENTGISGAVICAALSIQIGSECLLGADVMIFDNDFHSINATGRRNNQVERDISAHPIVLEDNVFIGARVTIMKGVRIGKNTVIGAGSVVTRDIPSNSIAAGNPARVVSSLKAAAKNVDAS